MSDFRVFPPEDRKMSSKVKAAVVVFSLLLFTSVVTVGCKDKAKDAWVNTNSMPGNTFASHTVSNAPKTTPGIVYLGQSSPTNSPRFGPSFEFKNLK